MVRQINHPAIAAKNSPKHRAQQRHQHFGAARGGHLIEDELLRDQGPEPAFFAIGAPARFVHIEYGLARQLLLQLPNRLFHCLSDFLPGFLGASQTEFDAKHVGEHGFHQPPRQPANHRPVGNQRRQLRTEVARNLGGQRRARRLPTMPTNHGGQLILGDVRLHGGQLGNLMPPRFSLRNRLSGLLRQLSPAAAAVLWQQYLDGAHLLCRKQSPMMSRVSGLRPRLPPALVFPTARPLCAGQPV
jgi:hypothetical protein